MAVAVITGASSGIGKETAEKMIEEGHIVYAAARRVENMEDLKARGAYTIKLDITQKEDIDGLISHIESNNHSVDILVNNAGYGSYGAMEDTPVEEARYQFDVNLFGLAELTKRVLPSMRKKKSGKIINISSIGGKLHTPLGSWYHATKFALEGWSDSLRLELKPFGIDVVVIEPGAIKTGFGSVALELLRKRSGESSYAFMATAVEKRIIRSYESGDGSEPEVIARIILKAIKARRPATRYMAGKYARSMIFLRKALGDRGYDRFMSRFMGL